MVPAHSILVSKRPDLVAGAVERASEWSEVHVYMDPGDFLASLQEAFSLDVPMIKVDDDDTYTTDHDRILDHYRGAPLWNMVKRYGCDGQFLGWRTILSGGVIPPGLFADARLDDAGRVEPWVMSRYPIREVNMGTRAEVCPARWLWRDHPAWLDAIDCSHGDIL